MAMWPPSIASTPRSSAAALRIAASNNGNAKQRQRSLPRMLAAQPRYERSEAHPLCVPLGWQACSHSRSREEIELGQMK